MAQGVHGEPERRESVLFEPAELGPVRLRNRLVKSATNEGLSRQGLVTDALVAWHRRIAAGGVGMTTLAYCSVSPEGRTFRHQMLMRPEALPGLRSFTEAVHGEGAAAGIQLGHAGWFANPRAAGARPVGPSRMFSPYAGTFSRAATEDDLARIRADFAAAAGLAAEAGFDAVEVHLGHGYLLSQFLSPHHNRRGDRFGGSLAGRARFPREVLRAVRDATRGRLAVTTKLNMEDGFAGGLEVEDSLEIARWIESDGSVDAIQLTGGHTTRTPMFLMRGEVPLREMLAGERSLVRRLGMRLLAPRMLRAWPYEEAFFLPQARRFRAALRLPLMLLGGLSTRASMEQARAEGFDFVALGRALIADPDLPERMRRGEASASRCTHCNRCVIEMERGGTRCVLDDPAAGS